MNVLVTGCWRTGSTALTNLIAEILAENGPTFKCFEDQFNHDYIEYEHVVVKTHKWYSDKKWVEWSTPAVPGLKAWIPHRMKPHYAERKMIFVATRDPGAIRKSMERFRDTGGTGNAADPDNLARGLEFAGLYLQHSIFEDGVNYSRYFESRTTQDVGVLVQRICNIFDFRFTTKTMKEIVMRFQAIQPPKTGYDNVNMLHSNHITDPKYNPTLWAALEEEE